MSSLSQKAVTESLKGGFPVADPVAAAPDASTSGGIIRSLSSSSNTTSVDPIEREVVRSLRGIVQLWISRDYPDEDVYQVLRSLVLPVNRPDEIRMYVMASNIVEADMNSLAEPLVMAAKKSNRLDELLEAVDQRSADAGTVIPATSMKALIAIEQNDNPEAIRLLDDLTSRVSKGAPSDSMHIALLTALKAFEQDDLKASAFPILRQSLQQEIQGTASNQNRQPSISGRLPILVNTYLASKGDDQAIRDYVESVLLGRQSFYSRYSGTYGLNQQWRDLGIMAEQTADLNLPTVALDLMGRVCDFEVAGYTRPSLSTALDVVARHLRTLPADDRYEAWHAWTMPAEGRKAIRLVTEVIIDRPEDKAFIADGGAAETSRTGPVLSNFTELISAAAETGKLAELQSELVPLVEEKMSDAEFLRALILIAQNDVEPATKTVQQLLETMSTRLKPESGRGRSTTFGEYLVYQACLQSESLAGLFENRLPAFRRRLAESSQSTVLPLLNVDWLQRVTAGGRSDALHDHPLTYWFPTSSNAFRETQPDSWTSHEDQIIHLGGFGSERLYFRYPLTGSFTVSIDCFYGFLAEGDAGYGGITLISQRTGSATFVSSMSDHERIQRPAGLMRASPGFNRLAIDVADGQMKYRLNNHLIHQEPLSPTSPWLVLTTDVTRLTSFRNLQFEGSPVIPRSVSLLAADRMDGWNCSAFGESQPQKRLAKVNPSGEDDPFVNSQSNETKVFDWNTTDGVLEGRPQEHAKASDQSWIYYHRPLQSNETFAYEFYYSPQQSVAHPTIGRVALMLEPDGVTSHWIAVSPGARITTGSRSIMRSWKPNVAAAPNNYR